VLDKAFTPDQEINAVALSLELWLPQNPEKTVAVLAFSNAHTENLIGELERKAIPYNDQLIKSTRQTHPVAKLVHQLLEVLLHPLISQHYAQLFSLLYGFESQTQTEKDQINRLTRLLQRCSNIETFVYPTKENDWLDGIMLEDQTDKELLLSYRGQLQRWLNLNSLPIDQQIISFASEVFNEPHHLAMAHKLAFQLRRSLDLASQKNEAFIEETFNSIIRNKENFLMFEDNQSFDPSSFPGKVVVSTIHKSKGLEWDRVYVMSVNNYDFPSGLSGDSFRNDYMVLKRKYQSSCSCTRHT
jgi:DNA helicase-2/ATP-dependent DNA helicase PcrA